MVTANVIGFHLLVLPLLQNAPGNWEEETRALILTASYQRKFTIIIITMQKSLRIIIYRFMLTVY